MKAPSPHLTVGVLVEQPIQAWAADAISAIAATPSVERTVIVQVAGRRGAGRRSRRPGPLALTLLARLDRQLVRVSRDAFAPARHGQAEPSTTVTATPAELGEVVSRLGLDVLTNLTQLDVDPRRLPEPPRLGVWELRHGGVRAGAPHALVRELAAGRATYTSTLVRRDIGGEEVLYASTSALGRLSLHRTRNAAHWKGAAFPARAVQLLALGAKQPGDFDHTPEVPAVVAPPSIATVALLQLKLAWRALRFLRERFLQTWSWSIVWQERETPSTSDETFRPDGVLAPPTNRDYADPFLVAHGGAHYVFYEDYRVDDRRAAIAVSRVVDGGLAPGQPVIRAPHHLSYPFTFTWDGEHYLVPESAEARAVQLYRAVRFPYEWELDATLLTGIRAYDATLVHEDGRWYMFAAVPVEGADIDELHVYWSTSLWGPYVGHALNPVVSDARRARPAGRILRDGGRLLRPGQDASGGYGSAVWLSEIEVLTPDSYRERPLARLAPHWSSAAGGTHTIDHVAGLQVMDVRQLRPRLRLARATVAT